MIMQSNYLKTAIRAAKLAEEVILKHFSSDGVHAEFKSDNSPVTIADKEAEKIIYETILAEFPDHGFLGEETGQSASNSEFTWVVDPIDGTRNFSRGIPHFGTLIALMKGEEVIVGVSNIPVSGEMLYAEKGSGTFLNDSKKVHVSETKTLESSYLSSGSIKYFSEKEKLNSLNSLVQKVNGAHGFGDSWTYHFLVKGNLDIVLEAYVSIWDIAALKIIVEEAGGRMTDLQGGKINKSTNTVLASNRILHDEILEVFKG